MARSLDSTNTADYQ